MRDETLRRIEYTAGIALSIFALVLLAIRATHAGALWRDECGALQVARMPTWREIISAFPYESFPLLFPATLRLFTTLAGAGDSALRLFGVLVGIGLLLVGWWSASQLRANVPLVFLTVAALNPTFFTWGTTIRGYGIGSVMIVFAFAQTANFLTHPTKSNALVMAAAFVAAVQCLVSNTALVFAIYLAAIAICFLRRDAIGAAAMTSALGTAALSYVPYIATYFNADWHVLFQTRVHLPALWRTFCDSLTAHNPAIAIAWLAFGLIATIQFIARVTRPNVSSLEIFALLTCILSLAGGFVFFELLSYPPQEWYFLPFVCLLAAALEFAGPGFAASAVVRSVRLSISVGAIAGIWWSSWPTITMRQSNVDLVANWLDLNARTKDLIVVNPWFFSISFDRYYHGAAPWITVPTMNERRVHRYDLLREKMSEDHPLSDVKSKIERTLRSGGRVYLLGGVQLPRENERALILPPAPQSQYGWRYMPYVMSWSQELAEFLQAHVQASTELPQIGGRVNPEEDIPLWWVRGWRD